MQHVVVAGDLLPEAQEQAERAREVREYHQLLKRFALVLALIAAAIAIASILPAHELIRL